MVNSALIQRLYTALVDHASQLTPWQITIYLFASVPTIHILRNVLHSLSLRVRELRHGCGPVPTEPSRLPLGIDTIYHALKADREQRGPDYIADRFVRMGARLGRPCHTFRVHVLGVRNFVTAEPRNLQAVLATQFADFKMGIVRTTNLRRLLGRSIFAVDGQLWESARHVVRPIFARENISNLVLLESHFQVMLECMGVGDRDGLLSKPGSWTEPVCLASLLPSLTIDSATELFLGESTHSLQTRLRAQREGKTTEVVKDFHWAFERAVQLLGIRLRLRGLYWVYGNRQIEECVGILHAFVDQCIEAADRAQADGTAKSKYDLLDNLRARCADRAEVREQVLGLLAAGRDTTASLTAWVFYCLVRDLRVFRKLRGIVLATFGPWAASSAADVSFEKLKGCTYLQHVMNETLRLHSVVPFNSRCAVRHTKLPTGGGPDGTQPVFVPAGTEVNFSSHVLHRRRDLWGDDADQFVPERWERKRPVPWSYIPFNGGPRICIGQQFALTEAGYVIVRMLQRFDDMEGLDVDPTRDYHNFMATCGPGSPVDRHNAVMCRLRLAED